MRFAEGSTTTASIRLEMQENMQRNAAVFRIQDLLEDGVKKMYEISEKFNDVKTTDRGLRWNTDVLETIELKNLLTCAC